MEIEINFKDTKSNQNKANLTTDYMSSKKKNDEINIKEDDKINEEEVVNTQTGYKAQDQIKEKKDELNVEDKKEKKDELNVEDKKEKQEQRETELIRRLNEYSEKERKENFDIQEGKAKRQRTDNFLFFIFTILYLIIVFMQMKVNDRYKIQNSLSRYFGFEGFHSRPASDNEPSQLFLRLMNLYQVDFWFGDKKYAVVSSIRSTLRRFKTLAGVNNTILKNYTNPLYGPPIVIGQKADPELEEMGSYLIQNESNITVVYDMEDSYMQFGGYTTFFKKTDLMSDVNNSIYNLTIINQVVDNFGYFVEFDASLLIVDFLLINYESKFIVPARFTISFSRTGMGTIDYNMMYIYTDTYKGAVSYFRTALEIINFFLLIYYTCFIIQSIRLKVHRKYNKILQYHIKREKQNKFDLFEKIDGKNDKDLIRNGVSDLHIAHRSGNSEMPNINKINQFNLFKQEHENDKRNDYYSYRDIELSTEKIDLIKKTHLNLYLIYFTVIGSDWLNIIQIGNLSISFMCYVLWMIFAVNLFKNNAAIDTLYYGDIWNYDFSLQSQNEIVAAANALESYRSLLIINFLLLFVKLISIFSKYIKSTTIFFKTMMKAFSDLLSFFVLFLTLLIGFSIFTTFYYGRYIVPFNDLIYSIQQNLSISLGVTDPVVYNQMILGNETISIIYFFLIIICLKFIVIKILLAIILHFFKISIDEYTSKERDMEKSKKLSKAGVGHAPIVSVLNSFKYMINYLYNLIFCRFKKLQLNNEIMKVENYRNKTASWINRNSLAGFRKRVSRDNRNSTALLSSVRSFFKSKKQSLVIMKIDKLNENYKNANRVLEVKDKELYNLKFYDDSSITSWNPYFTSIKEESKLKEINESKYRKIFIKVIFFSIFLVVTIIMIFLNTMAPWHKKFHSTLFDQINNQAFNNFTASEQFTSLLDYNQIKNFAFSTFPSIFQAYDPTGNSLTLVKATEASNTTEYNNFYVMEYNTLIQNKIIYSFKTSKYDPSVNDYQDMIRITEDISLVYMKQMNRTSFKVLDFLIPFSIAKPYRSSGGYTFTLDINDYYNNKWPNDLVQSSLFNSYLDYFIIEFICDNVENNFLAYSQIVIKLDYGAFKEYTYSTSILNHKILNRDLDYIQLAMEGVFVVLVIKMSIDYIFNSFHLSKSYEQWRKDTIKKLSMKTQDLRNHYNPELFRKIYFIFDYRNVIEFFVLVLSAYLIYLRVVMYYKEMTLDTYYTGNYFKNTDILEIRNYIYVQIDLMDNYQMVGSIIIFLNAITTVFTINLGKYFSLLIRTIDESSSNNFTFVIIMVFILPAFISYSFLAFGEFDPDFSTLNNTIMSCLNILFGSFDFTVYTNTSTFFGPLFYLLFIFIMKMILLNLFVAVIYSSYTKVKAEIRLRNEIWSAKRVFFFCCFRKKYKNETVKKNQLDQEFKFDLQIKTFERIMNIEPQSAAKALDEIQKEIEQIKLLDDELYQNKEKIKIVSAAFDDRQLGGAVNPLKENDFVDIEDSHIKCYNLIYLRKSIHMVELLEKDILNIETFNDHLCEYGNYFKYEYLKEEGKQKNDFMFEISAMFGKSIIELTNDIDELREVFDEIQKLDDEADIVAKDHSQV